MLLNHYILSLYSHTVEFSRGDVTQPNDVTISEFRNATAAEMQVMALSSENNPSLTNIPPNQASSFVQVTPDNFVGIANAARITITLDASITGSGYSIYRASASSDYIFQQLETTISNGQASAMTNQGGIFVAGTGVNYGLIVGVVVAGVVLVLVALMVIATVVYFVVRPEKWKATKSNVKKTQMKVKRSFARQV